MKKTAISKGDKNYLQIFSSIDPRYGMAIFRHSTIQVLNIFRKLF